MDTYSKQGRTFSSRICGSSVALFMLLWCATLFASSALADTCDYEKMFGREDKTIFGRDCGLCHSIGGPWDKPGGSLGGLFARKNLGTGEPVTEENVRKKIEEGGPGMPAFKYTLTRNQINDLIHYLKTVNCPVDESVKKLKEEIRKSQNSSQGRGKNDQVD